MATIINKRDYKITVNLLGGRSCDLLAKGTANIPDEDLASSHLQTLRGNGDILVIQASQAKKEQPLTAGRDASKVDTGKTEITTREANKKETPKPDTEKVEAHKTETHRKTAPKK
ncbi:MAG: hypothetical protein K6U80_10770 [Firmicutes bacterium]|nr:hypothetical protein [Bacillota bacterium]